MHVACFTKTLIIIVPQREREREALWRQSVVTLQCGDNGNGIREYFIRFFFSKKSQGAMAPAPLLPVREREYHIIYQLLSIYRICIFSQFKYICLNCNYKIKKKKKTWSAIEILWKDH